MIPSPHSQSKAQVSSTHLFGSTRMADQNGHVGPAPKMPLSDLDSLSASNPSVRSDCDPSAASDNGQRLSVASHGSTSSYLTEDDSCANCTDDDSGSTNSLHGSFSLPPSVCQHSYRFGRRYQTYRDDRYVLPNDEAEQAREALMHHMMLEALDGRHILAPIPDDVKMIMDLGTGTALWALDGEFCAMRWPSHTDILFSQSPICIQVPKFTEST